MLLLFLDNVPGELTEEERRSLAIDEIHRRELHEARLEIHLLRLECERRGKIIRHWQDLFEDAGGPILPALKGETDVRLV